MTTYLITRTPAKAAGFTRALTEQDSTAQVRYAPLLEAVALEPGDWEEVAFALIRGEFSWVTFTSVNGVLGLDALAQGLGQSLVELLGAAQVAAVGRATEAALTERGLLVDFVPETQSAAGMVDEWLIDEEWDNPMDETILAVQGTTASPVLEEGLTDYGYTVATLPVYEMVPYPAESPLSQQDPAEPDAPLGSALTLSEAVTALATTDVLIATSPLLLQTLAEAAGTPLPPTVAIGASTEAAARNLPEHLRPAHLTVSASPAPADLASAARLLSEKK
ncbi:uroporphyrinogen-III synthase [Rothia nasimurium]|uniref:uroporphyrinogen-III synthase n=1 Tax=Rothia nasimurium TaxID=85336 RepID=UPI001F3881C9|nr:uroporphyrinogen-III synthase [Rothia nasimurium]